MLFQRMWKGFLYANQTGVPEPPLSADHIRSSLDFASFDPNALGGHSSIAAQISINSGASTRAFSPRVKFEDAKRSTIFCGVLRCALRRGSL